MKIYGNDRALARLSEYKRADRMPHSLLFCGDKGTGKRLIADYTAMLYFCESVGDTPCMSCNNCKRIGEHIHPDVIYVDCAEAAAAELRDILRGSFELPVEGGIRVYILTEFQLLNRECQNALLAFLEEPSDRVKFILTASNRNGILPTILSRTALIQTEPLTAEQCAAALAERGCTDAQRLAAMYNGNLGMALRAFSEKNGTVYLDFARELVTRLISGSEYQALTLNQRLPQPKEDKREPVRELIIAAGKILHDSLAASCGGAAANGCDRELALKAANTFSKKELNELCSISDRFTAVAADINFNPKLTAASYIAALFACTKK